ncbi:Gfo/Idh/MocA family oxidoreductase [Microbacterium deminutum]|uniref:Gfo/Idh/MocA family protein n=1 Tax=Microbacterium deminutum TaxID=344164 RepID=UPI0031E1AD9D
MFTIGILGASHIAPLAVIRPARRRGVRLGAVASRRAGAAAAYAEIQHIERAYGTYEELLADSSIDLVYNSLPPSEHARWSIASLRAGKHVLCEKPFAMNATEAREMQAAARESGRRVIEAFHDRYHPLSHQIDAIVNSGRLGEIVEIRADFSVDMPFAETSIRHDPKLGGGALMDLGCYPVHWVRTLVGEEPRVTFAEAALNPLGADSSIAARLEFPSGIAAQVSCTFNGGQPSSTMDVIGTRGDMHIKNLVFPSQGHSISVTRDGLTWMSTVGGRETFDHQLDAVVNGIASGEPLLTEDDDPIHNMEVVDAIYAAAGLDRTWV